eukprot:CAMPEP_0170569298 /NCGR_PEP_ID=MMETSP0224-20130122/464_1 /TAXON_ID=285029 /ORGANISM="Togula jolla, Strain CCCM 725" /LENGTH=81 /DNA_ID=CAMNT_0010891423 /DNA_START=758 /DNA_END=1001 /DNA_ORIENTATION=+
MAPAPPASATRRATNGPRPRHRGPLTAGDETTNVVANARQAPAAPAMTRILEAMPDLVLSLICLRVLEGSAMTPEGLAAID